ncbi:MAG: hypothetical protein HQM03_00155 [Magnetococcales bacterium]|nr:hypothetical protein [Magnetococcales bacterium]
MSLLLRALDQAARSPRRQPACRTHRLSRPTPLPTRRLRHHRRVFTFLLLALLFGSIITYHSWRVVAPEPEETLFGMRHSRLLSARPVLEADSVAGADHVEGILLVKSVRCGMC